MQVLHDVEQPVAMSAGFGAWLAQARVRRGFTLEMLADRAETSAPTVSRLESGVRNGSRKMVLRLADALAQDGETEEDREARRNSALLAAGFVPNPPAGDQTGLVRETVDQTYHLYTGLSDEGRREVSSYVQFLWDRERRRREGDRVEEIEDEGDD